MELPKNRKGEPIVLGCNYHTTWQKFKSMRFVLHSVNWDRGTAILITRRTKKTFSTNVDDLVFIDSETNHRKAKKLINDDEGGEYLQALLTQDGNKKLEKIDCVGFNLSIIRDRVAIRKKNGKDNLVIFRDVGHLSKMTDEQYLKLLDIINSEFKTSHYESFCGSGEINVGTQINWE